MKWHKHFLERAHLVASMSKDPSTKCGAVIVGEDKEPISDGFNGFPRGMDDNVASYSDREFKYKYILHAEVNALLNALRRGTSVKGATMYITHPCCPSCACKIAQAGIKEVFYSKPSADFLIRWSAEDTYEAATLLGLTITRI